ncbi:hypothetical protein DNTS_004372, partial [Danionella cerebrum]
MARRLHSPYTACSPGGKSEARPWCAVAPLLGRISSIPARPLRRKMLLSHLLETSNKTGNCVTPKVTRKKNPHATQKELSGDPLVSPSR